MEEAGGESAPPCRSAGGARQEDGGTSVPMETGVGDAHAAVSLSPGVPIRGIKMKFAVLRGLVEAGEVPDKDLVETVFSLELHTVTMQEMFTPGRKDTRTPQNVLENIVDSTAGELQEADMTEQWCRTGPRKSYGAAILFVGLLPTSTLFELCAIGYQLATRASWGSQQTEQFPAIGSAHFVGGNDWLPRAP